MATPSFTGSFKSRFSTDLPKVFCLFQFFRDAFVPDCAVAELELFRNSLPYFFELFDAVTIAHPAKRPRIELAFTVVGSKQQNQAAIHAPLGRRELNKINIRQKRVRL
jgi:hypothetical protein